MSKWSKEELTQIFGNVPGAGQRSNALALSDKGLWKQMKAEAIAAGICVEQERDYYRRKTAELSTPRNITPEEHEARRSWPMEKLRSWVIEDNGGDSKKDTSRLSADELYMMRLSMWSHGLKAQKPHKPRVAMPVVQEPVVQLDAGQAAKLHLPKGTILKQSDFELLQGGGVVSEEELAKKVEVWIAAAQNKAEDEPAS